jgi:hypothetical protein
MAGIQGDDGGAQGNSDGLPHGGALAPIMTPAMPTHNGKSRLYRALYDSFDS